VTASVEPRLPRGRHRLSREEVAGSQRTRILRALAEVMAERGYVGTPVAAIIERAGVSRETFYQLFASKQDCFTAALEDTIEQLTRAIGAQVQGPGTPLEIVDRMVGAYLSALADSPATARVFLIETYAAGPEVMQRRLELQRRVVDGFVAVLGLESAEGHFACEAFVGAIVALATARFVDDDLAGLAELRGPLVQLAGRVLT
jgi:AcrR family transcriptional regulator